jgi:putative tricarboxylic transport membrane protein
MLEALISAFSLILSVEHFSYLIGGVCLGLAIGVFPGLGGIAGLSLLLPFLYGMDLVSALAMLVGLVTVIPTSDTFSSVLMGIPGSSASQATVLDGFPLAKRGEAARALGAAFSASLFGGLFGAALLSISVPMSRPLILAFGSAELFMLALLGLSMVGSLSGRSLVKGICSCGLGLTIGSIGGAPATGEFRMIMGIDYLYDGLPLVVVALGIFAVPEIVDLLRKDQTIAANATLGRGMLSGMRDVIRNKYLAIRCALIGAVIGAIPGMGGSVVDWIAYAHGVQTTRDKSEFGKGEIRGVIAPEAANNAKEGGGLLPTLLFGIPGSGAMAVFLGGLVLLGIEPGPSMVSTNLDLTYTIIWSLAIANVFGALLCLVLAGQIARLTTIEFAKLAPFMIVVISFAAFQATRDMMDLWALLSFGVLGVFMKRFGWSRPALLIGFVLAPQAEAYMNQAVQFYGWSMFTRPGVIVLLLLIAISLFIGRRGRIDEHGYGETPLQRSETTPWPQLAFVTLVFLLLLYAIVDGAQQSFLGGIFPIGVAAAAMPFAIYIGWAYVLGRADHAVRFDAEHTLAADEYRLGWPAAVGVIASLVSLSAIIGFLPGVVLFFVVFLRFWARATWITVGAMTLAVTGMLLGFERFLTLEYPSGLLGAYLGNLV